MNKHFQDAGYYLRRASKHARDGLREELEPLEQRLREYTGREQEPEPSRIERLQADLMALEQKAEGEARNAIGKARTKLDDYRGVERGDQHDEPPAQ
ncbi:DUF7553 family protein [Haloferacaceae archaeon DSL9]